MALFKLWKVSSLPNLRRTIRQKCNSVKNNAKEFEQTRGAGWDIAGMAGIFGINRICVSHFFRWQNNGQNWIFITKKPGNYFEENILAFCVGISGEKSLKQSRSLLVGRRRVWPEGNITARRCMNKFSKTKQNAKKKRTYSRSLKRQRESENQEQSAVKLFDFRSRDVYLLRQSFN